MHVLAAGDIMSSDNYGPADAAGFDVAAALRVRLHARATIDVGLQMTQIGLSFDGTGARSAVDKEEEFDVQGATDRYVGGFVTAGFSL